MRKQIRPGLDGDDFMYALATVDGVTTTVPKGTLITPAHRNDMKLWFDPHSFQYDMRKNEPISFIVRHRCSSQQSLTIRYAQDQPHHYLICPTCHKKWEYHQLEKMRPEDFSSTFEYLWTPKEKWPCWIQLASNGVTKYYRTLMAGHDQAAEYYYKEFIAYKNNGFKWSQQ